MDLEDNDTHYTFIEVPSFPDYFQNSSIGMYNADAGLMLYSLRSESLVVPVFLHIAQSASVPLVIPVFNYTTEIEMDSGLDRTIDAHISSTLESFDYNSDNRLTVCLDDAHADLEEMIELIRRAVLPKDCSLDSKLMMAVQRVSRTNSGEALVMGMICQGALCQGDTVFIYGYRAEPLTAVAEEIRIGNKITNEAISGDHVSVRLSGIGKEDLRVGQMLMSTIDRTLTKHVTASLRTLSRDEGGRHTPFFNGYSPLMIAGHAKTAVTIRLSDPDDSMVIPGQRFSAELELDKPIAAKPGTRISIWDGNLIATGQITDIEQL